MRQLPAGPCPRHPHPPPPLTQGQGERGSNWEQLRKTNADHRVVVTRSTNALEVCLVFYPHTNRPEVVLLQNLRPTKTGEVGRAPL